MTIPPLHHPLRRMDGRDPDERHRVASPLELLFDLTFAVAFSSAGQQFALMSSRGELKHAVFCFLFAMFGVVWAWINYTWFASAYDTDDWLFRGLTMVQMVGVVVMAIGFPPMYRSVSVGGLGGHLDNGVLVGGYIVMRVAMLAQWGRAWWQDPPRRASIRLYMVTLALAQVGWTLTAVLPVSLGQMLWLVPMLVGVEMIAPLVAERRYAPTPWHPHHMGERYSLLTIITLGEGVVGSTAALASAVQVTGWSLETILTIVAGLGLTFGMWWIYFMVDLGDVLRLRRERAFVLGYGHLLIFAAVAATGAGLQVVGATIAGQARISRELATYLVVVPVAAYVVLVFALLLAMLGGREAFHALLLALTAAVLATAVVMARLGVGMGWCLIVCMLAPFVTVVGFELLGHRHIEERLRVLGRRAG